MNNKFRVWCKDKNEWEKNECLLRSDGVLLHRMRNNQFIPLRADSHIVEMSTGLPDKNGVEIFAGDIVHCQATFDNANMVVIWEEGEFHMVLCEKYKSYLPLCGYYCIRNFTKEVFGNIHDNPELLESEE